MNNPEGRRVKVFAYCTFTKNALKLIFTHLGGNPNLHFVKNQPEKYKNQYFVELKNSKDFTTEIEQLIEKSFKDILKRQKEDVD